MKKTSVEIICPLYQAEEFLPKLHQSLLKQEKVKIENVHYILTESSDNSEKILQENGASYEKILKSDFSHSLVREKAGLASKADIICFITQDIEIRRKDWLEKLIEPIKGGKAEASFSRQLTKFDNIEKYTREGNYPDKSFIKDKSDIKNMGLKTFFFSDAAGAILKDKFIELRGYDGKNLPISEDMYFAYKLIMNDGRIAYVAESEVYHSHNFTLKQLYDRYKLTGMFMKQNAYLDQYGTNASGGALARYILKRTIQDKNWSILARYPWDMAARFIGMKVGKLK